MQNCHLESLLSLSVLFILMSAARATHSHTDWPRKSSGKTQRKREREEVEERRKKIEIKNGDMTGARFAHVENEGKPRRQETEQTEGQNEGQTDRETEGHTDRETGSYREAKAEVEDSR